MTTRRRGAQPTFTEPPTPEETAAPVSDTDAEPPAPRTMTAPRELPIPPDTPVTVTARWNVNTAEKPANDKPAPAAPAFDFGGIGQLTSTGDPFADWQMLYTESGYSLLIFRHPDPVHIKRYARPIISGELITDNLAWNPASALAEIRFLNGDSGGEFRLLLRDERGQLIDLIERYAIADPPRTETQYAPQAESTKQLTRLDVLREMAEEKRLRQELGLEPEPPKPEENRTDKFLADMQILPAMTGAIMTAFTTSMQTVMENATKQATGVNSVADIGLKLADKIAGSDEAATVITRIAGGLADLGLGIAKRRNGTDKPASVQIINPPTQQTAPAPKAADETATEAEIIEPAEETIMIDYAKLLNLVLDYAAENTPHEESTKLILDDLHSAAVLNDVLPYLQGDKAKLLKQLPMACLAFGLRGKAKAILATEEAQTWLEGLQPYIVVWHEANGLTYSPE